ncbi:S8 family serine peptidase, partial [Bacillus safensis]
MKGEIRLIPYEVKANVMEAKETPESIQEIKAPELWSSGFKGKGITIAVLDTGCDTEHPDLKDQIIGGKNFTDDDDGDAENVKDYNGHGTHVAGTIAATDQNGGILGVAPEAKLLIVKVLGGE